MQFFISEKVNVLAREVKMVLLNGRSLALQKNDCYPVLFLLRRIFAKQFCVYCVTSVRTNLEVTPILFHKPVNRV
jgi:hypothetical protein